MDERCGQLRGAVSLADDFDLSRCGLSLACASIKGPTEGISVDQGLTYGRQRSSAREVKPVYGTEKIGLKPGVKKPQRKGRKVRAFELRAFVAHDPPAGAVGALGDNRLFLMGSQGTRLDLKTSGIGSPFEEPGAVGLAMHAKSERMSRGLDAIFHFNQCGLLAALHTVRVLEKALFNLLCSSYDYTSNYQKINRRKPWVLGKRFGLSVKKK
jgi:hypothetical protein